jgi:hypothetical protein
MDDDRVALDEFNTIPHEEEWLQTRVQIVPLADFISTEEETAEALLGTGEETILPAGGMMLMYGDGGAGKTTLTVDACCHLAAGNEWLSLPVEKPVRITLIENEGPRGKFRQMLKQKAVAWNGHGDFIPNVHVLEEPWTRFTLKEEAHRQALAVHIVRTETDVVVMGPLATLGMVGGGTPDEINAFESLLRETRMLLPRAVAFWVIHHENKAGDVSGAWERVPDTLCHVQAQGNGYTRIHWRKARWASNLHGTNLDLIWIEGRSYQIKTAAERDIHAELRAATNERWFTVAQYATLIGASKDFVRPALSDLVERGEFEYQQGPPGRSRRAQCYKPTTGLNAPGQSRPVDSLWGSEDSTDSLTPLPVGGSEVSQYEPEPQTDSPDPGQSSTDQSDADDDIPF